jgi:hypothetical protein
VEQRAAVGAAEIQLRHRLKYRGFFVLLFAATLQDRRLVAAHRPAWSLREFTSVFYVNPRKNPDSAWWVGSGGYGVLYAGGRCVRTLGAGAILRVKRVR